MIKQHKDLEQLYGSISLHSTVNDAPKQESPTELSLPEYILTLKLDLEYWTWPGNDAPPPKVHHPHEGLGTSPNLYNDATISKLESMICLKSFNYFILLCGPKACPKYKPMLITLIIPPPPTTTTPTQMTSIRSQRNMALLDTPSTQSTLLSDRVIFPSFRAHLQCTVCRVN